MRIAILTLLCISLYLTAYAQPPNDLCQNAIVLPVLEEDDDLSVFDLTGATDTDPDAGPQDCYSYNGADTIQDIWFKVVVPSNGKVFIDITDVFYFSLFFRTSTIEPRFEAYTGACTNLQLITDQVGLCVWDKFNGLYYEGTPNEDIYIRVFDDQFDEEDKFTINAISTNESNNTDCSEAIALNVDQTCHLENYANNNGSPDNWFKFVYPANTDYVNLQIYRRSSKPVGYRVFIYSGDCQNLTLFDDYLGDPFGILIENRTPGETIFIRVDSHFNFDGAPYAICLFHKENDICDGALDLPVNSSCSPLQFSTLGSTQSLNPTANINCGFETSRNDVWLKAAIPASGNVTIEISNFGLLPNTSTDTSFEFYTGSCNNLNAVFCNGGTFDGQIATTRLSRLINLPPSQTLYIRVLDAFHHENYTICAYEEASYNINCRLDIVKFLGIDACDPNTNTVTAHFEAHYTAPAGLDLELNFNNRIPIALNSNPQTFSVEVPALGQRFTHQNTAIRGDCTSNLYRHFAIFEAPESCFNGTIQNDECIDAIVLTPSIDCSDEVFFYLNESTISDSSLDFTCSSSQEKDIWFTFTVASSNSLRLFNERLIGSSFFSYLDVYTGTCSNLIPISNPSCDTGAGSSNTISLPNLPIGEQVFIRLINCCNNGQGTFKMCLLEDCFPIVNINTPLNNDQFLYKASIEVNGDNIIDNAANVTFQGTERVNLLPGFEVTLNSIFEANLEGCN